MAVVTGAASPQPRRNEVPGAEGLGLQGALGAGRPSGLSSEPGLLVPAEAFRRREGGRPADGGAGGEARKRRGAATCRRWGSRRSRAEEAPPLGSPLTAEGQGAAVRGHRGCGSHPPPDSGTPGCSGSQQGPHLPPFCLHLQLAGRGPWGLP